MPGWKYAFSLSREAVKAATPPGTIRLIEHSVTQQNGKYIDRVAKFPPPTSDPADPLNWQPWRKFTCLGTLSMYAFVCNFAQAAVAPALNFWNASFPTAPRELEDLMRLVAFNVLVLGLGNIILVPLANVFGRRPIIILSTFTLFVASICGSFTSNFASLLAIRCFQGFGSAISETVVPAVVGDMFFVHERGAWMSLYVSCLAGGSVIGGICGGYIAARLGWYAVFWVPAILAGLVFLLSVFLVPETIYERAPLCLPAQRNIRRYMHRTPAPYLSLGTLPSMHMTLPSRYLGSLDLELNMTWYQDSSTEDLTSTNPNTGPLPPPPPPPGQSRSSKPTRSFRHTNATSTIRYPPYTYLRSLRFGMYRGNFLYQFAKPWHTLRLPATWIVMTQYGGLVGCVALISTVGPQILTLPPYEWGENSGLVFVGALVGIIFGGFYSSYLADERLKVLAKRQDHGFAEPESRIPIMLPSLAIATGGLLVFGFCAQYPGPTQWIGLEFAHAMVAFALTQVPSCWFNYLIDSYAQLASDCFVMICILRGLTPFSWTFFVTRWIKRDGYLVPFGGFTVIMAVFSLMLVPLIWTGKRVRIATARYVVSNQ